MDSTWFDVFFSSHQYEFDTRAKMFTNVESSLEREQIRHSTQRTPCVVMMSNIECLSACNYFHVNRLFNCHHKLFTLPTEEKNAQKVQMLKVSGMRSESEKCD